MYAVIQLGSNQYKVSEGDRIEVQKLTVSQDKKMTLDKVLLFANGKDVRIGLPYLKDVKVSAVVEGQQLGDKTFSFKFRRRKGSTVKKGHRHKLTALTVTKIESK